MSMTAPTLLKQLRRAEPLLLLILVPLGLRAAQQRRPVQAIAHTIEAGELTREVFGRGAIESEREAALGFDLSGRIAEVLVVEGQRASGPGGRRCCAQAQARSRRSICTSRRIASGWRAELDRVLAQRGEASRSISVARRRRAPTRATLLAPFDGIITRRDTASVGVTVLRLMDAERVYARAWIDESALGALAEG
jgi:hypothetical protein